MSPSRQAYARVLLGFAALEMLCAVALYAVLLLVVWATGLHRVLMVLPFPLPWVVVYLAGYACGWLSDVTWGVLINRRRRAALDRLERRG